MKLFRKVVCVFLLQWVFIQSVQAEESSSLEVFPRAGIGLNWLAYTRLDDTELDAFYVTMNVGMSLNYSQFYLDLSGELLGVDNVEKEGQITSVEREDITATIGYLPSYNTSVFFGYTVGETKDDFRGEFHQDRGFFARPGWMPLFLSSRNQIKRLWKIKLRLHLLQASTGQWICTNQLHRQWCHPDHR